jgi:hypothetical protein
MTVENSLRRRLVLSFVLGLTVSGALAQERGEIRINGRRATQADLRTLAALERASGVRTPPGSYWYDNFTGANGRWGGPTAGFLRPGLALGGPLPAQASGGGAGLLTGVFINARELHPVDVQMLSVMLQLPIQQGRWWVDGFGNCGLEGGPPLFNLFVLGRVRGGGAGGSGCSSASATLGVGDEKRTYTHYSGCD